MNRRKFFQQSAALVAVPMLPSLASLATSTPLVYYTWEANFVNLNSPEYWAAYDDMTVRRIWSDGKLVFDRDA